MNANPLIAKIVKLLALADNQEGLPEGELAAKLAARMMREHAISEADVNGVSLDTDPLLEGVILSGRTSWRSKLAYVLAKHCNCTALRHTHNINSGGSQTAYMKIFGHRTDVEVCQYLYELCEKQIDKATEDWKKTREGTRYGEGQAFRESAIMGLSQKLHDIRAAGQTEDPTGTALVLSRAKKADEYMRSVAKIDGKYKGGSKSGFSSEGYEAGRKIRLHAGVGDGQARHLGEE